MRALAFADLPACLCLPQGKKYMTIDLLVKWVNSEEFLGGKSKCEDTGIEVDERERLEKFGISFPIDRDVVYGWMKKAGATCERRPRERHLRAAREGVEDPEGAPQRARFRRRVHSQHGGVRPQCNFISNSSARLPPQCLPRARIAHTAAPGRPGRHHVGKWGQNARNYIDPESPSLMAK